jgi:hypothetical protein
LSPQVLGLLQQFWLQPIPKQTKTKKQLLLSCRPLQRLSPLALEAIRLPERMPLCRLAKPGAWKWVLRQVDKQ